MSPTQAVTASPDRDAALRTAMAALRKRYPDAMASCVEALPEPQEHALGDGEPVLMEFVRSMLLWESTLAKATLAMKRFEQQLVDVNELRICMPGELLKLLGERYPKSEERAVRLRTALNEVYQREHAVTLEHLPTLTKKEAREYLESLEGVPGFVSARVHLVCIGGHAAPVDRRICARLIEAGIVEEDATPDAAASQLERKIQAGEMLEAYALLQAWADDHNAEEIAPEKTAGKKSPSKTTKKSGGPKKKSS